MSLTKDLINHVTADSNHGRIIMCKLPRSDSLIVNPPKLFDHTSFTKSNSEGHEP